MIWNSDIDSDTVESAVSREALLCIGSVVLKLSIDSKDGCIV